MPGWKFLTNHALVLYLIAQQPRITAREIASSIGITEKATRNIINDLESGGYVAKKREGRRIRYKIDAELPVHYTLEPDRAIGDLLEVMGWRRRRPRAGKEAPPAVNG